MFKSNLQLLVSFHGDQSICSVNDAMKRYKLLYCQDPHNVNLKERMILHEAHKKSKHLLNSIIVLPGDST